MKTTYIIAADEIDLVVQKLYDLMRDQTIFTFSGPLGAGKTTLVRSLLRRCGVTDPVTSPTFNYVNMYNNTVGQKFFHFDLYRIETVDDFIMAGFDEYLHMPNSWVFIEWPEVIDPLLQGKGVHVVIDYHDEKRKVECIIR